MANHPSFSEAFHFWLKLGFISFGGPTGQIAIMHKELVENRRWISEARFLHALNFCMLLPGPEAQQLATYIGWLLHRTWGGVVAGALFVLPSMLILWALSWIYVSYGKVPVVAAVFYGLKPAVLAIVAAAAMRIGSKALKTKALWLVAIAAFVAIYFFKAPFPAIVFSAGLLGWLAGRNRPDLFPAPAAHGGSGKSAVLDDSSEIPAHARPSLKRALRLACVCLLLWWAPVALIALWLGPHHTLVKEGIFFSKAAMVTFGGAYAVLPYVSQQAVENYGWLSATQMMDGLGLAETTPGPLIMVLQFVGFLGGYHHPGQLTPMIGATLGAFITTWTTFLPCFLWIFLGAPYIERLRGNRALGAALTAVTAAVVGVILNLAVWFGAHVLFPDAKTLDWFSLAIAVIAFIGLHRWKWGVIQLVLGAGLAGVLYKMFVV
ncbi:MAG TPA: chromate efflux transporter [Methylomirabilota bacterium]|nr:chromate efflux transporter [Methylomirabilota bacterium]